MFLVVTVTTLQTYTNTVKKQSETLRQGPSSISVIPTTTESSVSPIETWNTDTDSLKGLSFKYPKEWKITDTEPERIVILTSWYLPYNRSIEIEVKDNPAQFSLQDFLMQDLEDFFDEEVLSGLRIEPVSGTTISGVRTIGIPEGFSNILSMFVANYNGKILEITLLSGGEIGGNVGVPVAQEDEQVFLQIIGSLEMSRSVTPPPAPPGWQTHVDAELGFLIQNPVDWHDTGLSDEDFKLRCFEPVEEIEPTFCVRLNPWVSPDFDGFFSNSHEVQQRFFESLKNHPVGQPWEINTHQFTVTRHDELLGAPAIEVVETYAPDVEILEPFYTVTIYVNHPQAGLIDLGMGALDREQFEQYEEVYRQMLDSFTLLK